MGFTAGRGLDPRGGESCPSQPSADMDFLIWSSSFTAVRSIKEKILGLSASRQQLDEISLLLEEKFDLSPKILRRESQ